MKNRMLLIPLVLLLVMSLGVIGCPEQEVEPYPEVERFPTRPITLIVSFSPGGGTDVGARLLVPHVEELLGQPITVKNIAGGGGWVGWTELIAADPDGYTIGYLNTPALQTGFLNPELANPHDLGNFSFITNHVWDPGVIAVRADSPFMTLDDLIEFAIAHPGELSFTTTGALGDDHLRLLLLEQKVPGLIPGESFKAVHGRGAADSITLVLGGHTDILAVNVGEAVGLVRDEKVRALAVSDSVRSPFLPDVPTLKELGFPIINQSARGIGGPAGIPEHILEILIEAFTEGMMHPEHVAAMEKVGLALRPITGDEYRQMHQEEERIIREILGW